jgi:hypothetical protein
MSERNQEVFLLRMVCHLCSTGRTDKHRTKNKLVVPYQRTRDGLFCDSLFCVLYSSARNFCKLTDLNFWYILHIRNQLTSQMLAVEAVLTLPFTHLTIIPWHEDTVTYVVRQCVMLNHTPSTAKQSGPVLHSPQQGTPALRQ